MLFGDQAPWRTPMAEKDLNELFLDTLKDIYYAEKHILKALPKMAKAATSDQLRAAFEKHYAETKALDAGLLAAAQAVEHYEISRYGTLKAWAAKLNMPEAVKLLDATLAEEKKTDEALSKLAEKAVNYEAAA